MTGENNTYYKDSFIALYNKDCKDMSELEDNSIDLVVTDPPYGYSFMGKDWDKAVIPTGVWKECLRVLKPGAFAFVMCSPRQDCLGKMICNLSDAGFETGFTSLYWAYASGFPKAQNIGKAVDKRNGRTQETYKPFADYLKKQRLAKGLSMAQIDERLGTNTAYSWWKGRLSGIQLPTRRYYLRLKQILDLDNRFDELIEREEAEREVVGQKIKARAEGQKSALPALGAKTEYITIDETVGATPQAKALDGSYGGFQPKPAVEVILVVMKPLSEKTFVDQALQNRKGISWLDDCRIPYDGKVWERPTMDDMRGNRYGQDNEHPRIERIGNNQGRFPANLIVSDDVLNDGRITGAGITGSGKAIGHNKTKNSPTGMFGIGNSKYDSPQFDAGSFSRYFDLDKWAQKTFPFLMVPKASKGEKNKYLGEDIAKRLSVKHGKGIPGDNTREYNIHPTVKPLKLVSYLITLGSREGDTILDNFVGSGTTLLAAKLMGRKSKGYEIKQEYCEIAVSRCRQMILEM